MGILDSNRVLTTHRTGLEGSLFEHICSNEAFDLFEWRGTEGKNLRVTYRDYFAWSDDNAVYLIHGKITDTPTKVEVNETNFPGLRRANNNPDGAFPKIARVIAVPCQFIYGFGTEFSVEQWDVYRAQKGTDCRICVIFTNGQVYHNYQACYNTYDFWGNELAWLDTPDVHANRVKIEDLFTKFSESCLWDLPTRKSPVKTQIGNDATLIATETYYYNPSLPDRCYEMHPAIGVGSGYSNTNGFPAYREHIANGVTYKNPRFWRINMDDEESNSMSYMGGFTQDNQFTMIGTYRNNNGGVNGCRICVFATEDGGRNWYVSYEFGGNCRLYFKESYENIASAIYGIQCSQVGNASSGIYRIRRRKSFVPSADTKEPAHKFMFDSFINVSSIAGTSDSIVVTTESAHSFTNGDLVQIDFQPNVSEDDRTYDWMINSTAGQDDSGNGIFFIVKSLSATTISLTQNIYNPDNNLPVRHIHALNRCKDGVAISSGETYPQGWVIYGAIQLADTHAGWHPWNPNHVNWVRLNSTKNSIQRPLGTIVKQEYVNGQAETVVLVGVDNEYTPMEDVQMPEGRTETFKHNSTGVYKTLLQNFDSATSAEVLLPERENCYGLQYIGNALVFIGQFGTLAISLDDGKSWVKAVIPQNYKGELAQFSGMTYDRRFSIGNSLIQLK